MALRVVRKLFLRKRKDASNSSSSPDWCGDVIKITKIVASASDLAPFPCLKGAANVLVALLEPLQQLQKNKDDFRELAEEICKLLVMLRDRLIQYDASNSTVPNQFSELCMDFSQCLLDIQSDMGEMMRQQSVRMRGYFKASIVQDFLARYKAQFESLRLNFMMFNISDMRVQLADIRGLLDPQEDDTTLVERPSANLDIDTSDYKQISIGDLQAVTEPLVRHRGSGPAIYTEDLVVKHENASKTLRVYRGQDPLKTLQRDFHIKCKLRHPYLVQLFGICSSRHIPGLVFHGELTSCLVHLQSLSSLEAIAFSFRMYRQWQSACQYLSKFEPFGCRFADEIQNVYLEGRFDDCHWYTYLNGSKDLQISVEHPTPRQDNVVARSYQYSRIPPISQTQMAMIETVLAYGVLPTNVDKKTCLLAFYKSILSDAGWTYQLENLKSSGAAWPRHVFVNPMGSLRGGRLVFADMNDAFKWHLTRWDDSDHQCERHRIGKWTRFTIPSTSSTGIPDACRYAWAKFLSEEKTERYMWTWLAQAESLRERIRRHECVIDDNILIGREIEFEFSFQTVFTTGPFRPELHTVYLFVADLGVNGDIESYWSVDPEGHERLSSREMTLLGLRKPSVSMELHAAHWSSGYYQALRTFHQVCGFDPASNDATNFLRLPVADFEANERTLLKRWSDESLHQGKALERVGRAVRWQNGTFTWSRRRSSFSARHDVRAEPWQWYKKLWDAPQCWLD